MRRLTHFNRLKDTAAQLIVVALMLAIPGAALAQHLDPEGTYDYTIEVSDSPDPVTVGQNLTYTIKIINSSDHGARTYGNQDILTFNLPAGVTFVSASFTKGTCSHSGGVVTCTVGNDFEAGTTIDRDPPNNFGIVTIVVKVEQAVFNARAARSYSATKSITAGGTISSPNDPFPANNSGSTSTTVVGADAAGVQAEGVCTSRRKFRIRIRRPRGLDLASARVLVDGKKVEVRKGRRFTATVDLRKFPDGRFTVRIKVQTRDGRKFSGKRRYLTCTPGRVSKGPIQL